MSLKHGNRRQYEWWALGLILLINAALKWKFFCGLVEADDFSYALYSFSLYRIPMPWDMSMDFRVLRLAFIFPVAMLFRFLPPTELVAVIFPMAASFGTIVMVFLIGKKLYGVHAGIFAAFALATFPSDVIYGTMLLPDIIVPFYLGLTVWTFLNGIDGVSKRPHAWFAASGVSMFLAFIARENSYYFLVFFLPFAFNKKSWKRGMYLSAVSFTVAVLLLYGFYFIKSGDFLFNLHVAQHYRDPLIESGYIPPNERNWFVLFYMMLPVLYSKMVGRLLLASGLFGYIFYPGVAAVIYTTVKYTMKKKYLQLTAPWLFLLIYLYLDFGTVSFTSYQMMRKLDRFLLTLTPAMALCYGVALTDMFGLGREQISHLSDVLKRLKKRRRYIATSIIAIVVMAFVLTTSYFTMASQYADRNRNLAKFRWGYNDVLKNRPHRVIYNTGGWWENKLAFYMLPDLDFAEMLWHRSESLRDMKGAKATELAGSYVIIDRTHFSGENDLRIRHSYDEFGTFVRVPPEDWQLIGSQYSVEIYEVSEGWTYEEPNKNQFAMTTMKRALETGDIPLFLSILHPSFLAKLDQERFSVLVNRLTNSDDAVRQDMVNRIEFLEDADIIKIVFNLN